MLSGGGGGGGKRTSPLNNWNCFYFNNFYNDLLSFYNCLWNFQLTLIKKKYLFKKIKVKFDKCKFNQLHNYKLKHSFLNNKHISQYF